MRTFPDVNVLLALIITSHAHHPSVKRWHAESDFSELVICRITQLGLLRLLTTQSVMGVEVLTNSDAWKVYDSIVSRHAAILVEEPYGLEAGFRGISAKEHVAAKTWTDAYLAAFASRLNIPLVTLDRSLASTAPGSILISA